MTAMSQKIEVYRKQVYSETYTYVADPKVQDALFRLTSHKTLTEKDKTALEDLGFEFVLVIDPSLSI